MSSAFAPVRVAPRSRGRRLVATPAVPRDDDVREAWRPRALEARARDPVGRSDGRAVIERSHRFVEPADADVRRLRVDADAEEFAATISSPARQARLRAMLVGIARVRYGVAAADAHDIYQDSVVAYLPAKGGYAPDANHFGMFVGIFRRKALEFLTEERRRRRRLERFAAHVACERRGSDAERSPEAAARRVERDAAIRESVASLPHDARAVLLDLAEGRCRRLDFIARLGINRNTFDSRLHLARARLLRDLRRRSGF